MTTPDAESVFIDTNILVYATIAESPLYGIARSHLRTLQDKGIPLFVNNQVIREYLVTLTRPGLLPSPPGRAEVLDSIRDIRDQYTILSDDDLVGKNLIELLRNVDCGGKQIHDANIVATMVAAGVPTLLTENSKDFRRFDSYISIVELPTSAES